ncbi:MAG: branched-chain amino acid transport system substrate-binding protein, partial [Trebonia sp.]|nr:branched-chain amino acid transport system substrate-binding protein [Trebonia sp.]
MIRRRTTFKVAAAAATALLAGALAACGGGGGGNSASANSTIVVCSDEALSGVYAQIGESDNWGSEAYFKHVNATGGILGHKVNYISLNNQSNAAQSELDAKKCIQTYHAQLIVGPESGADTESALPIAIANKTILISLSSGWQTNGYPASELTSYGFPGFYDVFAEDQIASVQNLIVPRHYTRVALLEDNCGSVCLSNQSTVQGLAKKDGFQLVSTQIDPVGATDVTPQVLAMLAAKPQIILLGLVPGTDSITAIKAIRAQDPTIPISECSGCEIPSFVSAAGGATAMQNIYVLGSMKNWLTQAQAGTTATDKATAAGLKAYIAGMQAAGLGNDNAIENSQEGWDAGLEIQWAIQQAGNLDETTIMQKLQHLDINTLGIVWTRTPQNYESYSDVDAAMAIIKPDGTASLY